MELSPAFIARETDRRQRRLSVWIGDEVLRLRTDANLSVRALAHATGLDPSYLGDIEAGRARPSTSVLIAVGIALGADLSVRYFAGSGPRIHDRVSARMSETFLRSLHTRWRPSLEVPVGRPSRGVVDLVLEEPLASVIIATEFESQVHRLEQEIRWSHEKAVALGDQRGVSVSELLVLRSTRANRELANLFEATLRTAYPAKAADAVAALTGEARWPGAAIVWMRVDGAEAHVMRYPPPGVRLGR